MDFKAIFELKINILVMFKLCFRFNYRSTHYMVNHGFYNFLNWFDERAWYPLGRIVGGTVSEMSFRVNSLCSKYVYMMLARWGIDTS